MSGRRTLPALGLLMLVAGLGLFAERGYLCAKAALAEVLIARAFAAHLEDGRAHRPWSWADMEPIARLKVPRLKVRRYVLSGSSGTSMAFGIGHVDGTARPNRPGNCVLAGHRDSWLEFLGEVEVGDKLDLSTRESARRYVVRDIRIVDRLDTEALEPTADARLTLVTCYPFDALGPGRQRYVVTCGPEG